MATQTPREAFASLITPRPQMVFGVNDPKPSENPEPGMRWLRMRGGPMDGQWVQVKT